MISETDFLARYRSDRPMLEAWGAFVTDAIARGVRDRVGDQEFDGFFKIPPSPRLKSEKSLADKAFRRGKQYADPYEAITDKVGVRFVVLLIKNIATVTDVIESIPEWTASKDRDFELERERSPLTFDYQSKHYIVRASRSLSRHGVSVSRGTSCEVQVRTLLQHAYSEMAHDTVYKPSVRTDPKVLRAVARSMALIETTDGVFGEVSDILRERSATLTKYEAMLHSLYEEFAGIAPAPDRSFSALVLDAFSSELAEFDADALRAFFAEHPNLADEIRARAQSVFVYSQPVTLLVYALLSKARHRVKSRWPGSSSDLRPLYGDLGISFAP